MEKMKVRTVVGWRSRESKVRDIRSRMRASSNFKAAPTPLAEAAKKK